MEFPSVEEFINAEYSIDSCDQGYFEYDFIANQGRVVSALHFGKRLFSYPIRPFKLVFFALATLVSSVAAAFFAIRSLFLEGLERDLSQIRAFDMLKTAAAVGVYCLYSLTCLVFKIVVIGTQILGICLPEIGRKGRWLEKAYEKSVDEAFNNLEGISEEPWDESGDWEDEFEDYFHHYQPSDKESENFIHDGQTTKYQVRLNALNVLGLDRSATDDAIKKKYKRLAIQYHPDKNPQGVEKFKAISAAYEILMGKPATPLEP